MATASYLILEERFRSYYYLRRCLSVLNWDSAVVMSKGSAKIRAQQIAALTEAMSAAIVNNEVKHSLSLAAHEKDQLNDWQNRNLAEMQRILFFQECHPPELRDQIAKKTVECELTWREAKSENNFKLFSRSIKPLIELIRIKSEILAKGLGTDPYSALMQEFDPAAASLPLQEIFKRITKVLPRKIALIAEAQSQLSLPNPKLFFMNIKDQKELCHSVLKMIGFDFLVGRLDESKHPFTEGGVGDCRVATSYQEDDFKFAILSTLHEGGHALYDLNLPHQWHEQPVGYDRGMVAHEGVALFYEMIFGKSEFFLGRLSELLNKNQHVHALEDLKCHFNLVRPGPIRIEADEVTYLPHIILRFEIESQLLDGKLNVDDIPDYWNSRSLELLGVQPKSFSEGCLQDVHWSLGLFGYFPSYAKGLLLAMQMAQDYHRELASLKCDGLIRRLTDDVFSQGCFHRSLPSESQLFLREHPEQCLFEFLDSKFAMH